MTIVKILPLIWVTIESINIKMCFHKWSYKRFLCCWLIWNRESSLVSQILNSLPTMQETQVWSLGWDDPLEKGMATHSSTLAWRIPWTKELVGYILWGHRK